MTDKEKSAEIIWRPLPGSQTIALASRAHHTLYEGARGPGKTVTQLMRFLRNVGRGYGQYWRGIIFDLEYDNLAGLVAESKKWFRKFNDGAKFLESASQYKWVWTTGEELLFRHVKKLADYEGFHGHEYPFIGWNELTKYSSGELYDKFMSVNRCSFSPVEHTPKDDEGNYLTPDKKPLPPIPLEVFSTTNPHGVGHNWVKKKFIDVAPRGTLVKREVLAYNPATKQEEICVKTQIAIFGSYKENPYLPVEYVADLESITDENRRRAWLYGDWDVTSGGAVDDLFNANVHVVKRFSVPSSWRLDRSFDDGSTHPFAVCFWAEADGTEATYYVNGEERVFCPEPGSLIQFAEWYGGEKDKNGQYLQNTGLKLSAADIADGIKDIESNLFELGWIDSKVNPGPADNRICNVYDSDTETTATRMKKRGIEWTRSDKSPGSRVLGLQALRDRLQASLRGEGPGIYFMDNCVATLEFLPTLPRDPNKPDDVDTKAEDHVYDAIRYRVLKSKAALPPKKYKIILPF